MLSRRYWLDRPVASAIVTLVMLGGVTVLDHFTDPRLTFAIAYFLPISFAAWTLGRGAAYAAAIASDAETINDQLIFIRTSGYAPSVGIVEIFLRLLIFLFVAELTYRLIQSVLQARLVANELRIANDKLNITYERLNEDISMAGLLQSNVLSFDPPRTSGCEVGACLRMAGPIGGDFADAGFVDDDIYACVADIAGKGIPAALFSTLLKHLLIDAHKQGLRSSEVVAALNTGLSQTLPIERFVTLFYVEIDPSTGVVEYVNAGHPDGLLFHCDTGEIEQLPPTGPILTLFSSTQEFPARTIQLEPKDVLILYTDGAIESKIPSGDRLGEEPIKRLVIEHSGSSAQQMAGEICDGIEEAVAGSPGDDLTTLCIKMTAAQEILPGMDTGI